MNETILTSEALTSRLFWKGHWIGVPFSYGGFALKVMGRWYSLREFVTLDPRDQRLIDLEGQNDARAYEEWPRERRLDKPSWCTSAVVDVCKQIVAGDDHWAMPILADAFEEAGFDDARALETLRAFDPNMGYSLLYAIQVRRLVWRIQNGTN